MTLVIVIICHLFFQKHHDLAKVLLNRFAKMATSYSKIRFEEAFVTFPSENLHFTHLWRIIDDEYRESEDVSCLCGRVTLQGQCDYAKDIFIPLLSLVSLSIAEKLPPPVKLNSALRINEYHQDLLLDDFKLRQDIFCKALFAAQTLSSIGLVIQI